MDNLNDTQIIDYINRYRSNIQPNGRYASFDYCYNYFQSFKNEGNIADIAVKEHIEKSTLQLAFYLASWGMYRASTALFEHSSVVLVPVIETIANTPSMYWEIDVDNYPERIPDLIELYNSIGKSIEISIPKKDRKLQKPTITLITKIMLGVFGNTPALDSYVLKGIGQVNYPSLKKPKALEKIWRDVAEIYQQNQLLFNDSALNTTTLLFTGGNGAFLYPKAKLIDMLLFEHGLEITKSKTIKS